MRIQVLEEWSGFNVDPYAGGVSSRHFPTGLDHCRIGDGGGN